MKKIIDKLKVFFTNKKNIRIVAILAIVLVALILGFMNLNIQSVKEYEADTDGTVVEDNSATSKQLQKESDSDQESGAISQADNSSSELGDNSSEDSQLANSEYSSKSNKKNSSKDSNKSSASKSKTNQNKSSANNDSTASNNTTEDSGKQISFTVKIDASAAGAGTIADVTMKMKEGSSAYDALIQLCKNNKIQYDSNYSKTYGTAYVKAINNIYEKSKGNMSGWKYKVNGVFPNYGSSKYKIKDGDKIVWIFVTGG